MAQNALLVQQSQEKSNEKARDKEKALQREQALDSEAVRRLGDQEKRREWVLRNEQSYEKQVLRKHKQTCEDRERLMAHYRE